MLAFSHLRDSTSPHPRPRPKQQLHFTAASQTLPCSFPSWGSPLPPIRLHYSHRRCHNPPKPLYASPSSPSTRLQPLRRHLRTTCPPTVAATPANPDPRNFSPGTTGVRASSPHHEPFMYIPRNLFSSAYAHLKANAHFATSSILILCALDTDSICATRILTSLLKRDYIQYQIKPIAGYQDLEKVNATLVRGNEALRFVICLGLGGLIDISTFLDLGEAGGEGEVECWIIDGRRPWHLENVYAGGKDMDDPSGRGGIVEGGRHGVGEGVGGIKCFDDGDIADEMGKQAEAFKALMEMPEVDDDSDSSDDDEDAEESDDEDGGGGVNLGIEDGSSQTNGKKRKSSEEPDESDDESRSRSRVRRQRRDSDASSGASTSSTPLVNRHTLLSHGIARPIVSSPPPVNSDLGSPTPQLPPPLPRHQSTKQLRRKLRRLRQKHTTTISAYYAQGTWYGEPVSSLLYSLASDLGREDNDLLWLSIVGVCSGETYGRTISCGPPRAIAGNWVIDTREDQILAIMRDEVRRLNPPDLANGTPGPSQNSTALQTTARSPNDTAIRISPEYRFMMIRHWSLYDAMLHSSYLGTKLHIWSEHGKKRLHKLLAKMGFSLAQCKQSYTHMDMDLKRSLKEKLERYAPLYGLEGIIKDGFVRCWGWRGCLSAADVGYIIGGILEVGKRGEAGVGHGLSQAAVAAAIKAGNMDAREVSEEEGRRQEELEVEEFVENFWAAFDALEDIEALKSHLPTALTLHRAILRTGTTLIEKRQIKTLRSFRLAVVREGPDLPIFTHPNALTKLSLWLSEAVMEQERERGSGAGRGGKHLPLVVASLNERRDVYCVVGMALGAQVEATRRIVRRKGREQRRREREERRKRKLEKEGLDPIDGEDNDDDDDDPDKKKKKKKKADGEGEGDEEDESESESESEDEDEEELMRGGRNRFGIAFQEVANSTQARIRIDSFEATVVEVKKEDLAGFLESLSFKSVIG